MVRGHTLASSPITTGGRVFLTCYTGGAGNLERILVCIDEQTGKILWHKGVKGVANEDRPNGMLDGHGYASSTPATDGNLLYVFLGKNGVGALTLDGKPKWSQSVGTGKHNWGSGTSPVIHKNLVIVNASVEGSGIVALNKTTGKQAWAQRGVSAAWNSPKDYSTARVCFCSTSPRRDSTRGLGAMCGSTWGFSATRSR